MTFFVFEKMQKYNFTTQKKKKSNLCNGKYDLKDLNAIGCEWPIQ